MAKDKIKRYVYIVKAEKETAVCKIGITDSLERRLKEYNSMTGKSKGNSYQYLFTCKTKNGQQVEKYITKEYGHYREEGSREIYLYNSNFFNDYVKFIKSHKLFIKEIFIKTDDKKELVKIIKKTIPSLEDRGLSFIDVINKAKKVKDDEFFTRYEDVEKELNMYDNKIWKDKVVFCNCDNAVGDTKNKDNRNTSAFALYFIKNFEKLGLKKLICTHYAGVVDLFHQGPKGYIFTYIFIKTRSKESKNFPKGYTGSFDDPLSLKILNEEADIVCTNPPFSRMRDYWKILIKSGKKFIIISNIVNPISTAYIPYFKENKVWAGYNRIDNYLNRKRELVEAGGHWYTNISIKNRPKYTHLKIMTLKEIPDKYKKYDDDKMLLVDNCYVPNDYKKPFAVSARPILNGLLEKGYKIVQDKQYDSRYDGKIHFKRVVVQKI